MLLVLMRVRWPLILVLGMLVDRGILWLFRSSQPPEINFNPIKKPTLNNLLKYTMVNKE